MALRGPAEVDMASESADSIERWKAKMANDLVASLLKSETTVTGGCSCRVLGVGREILHRVKHEQPWVPLGIFQ